MTGTYRPRRRRGLIAQGLVFIEDFMNWFLYGSETWVVALLKGVPLFLYAYFLLLYVPNYAYYLTTQYLFHMSDDVGFLVANGVGITNMVVLIILVLWTQAARGRVGFWWTVIRYLDFLQYLGVVLLLIPLMAFNLAGGTFVPDPGRQAFPLQALGLGTVAAGGGAVSLVYLYLEYRRITRREARRAAAASAAYAAR
ncbi:MAG: hypothetical protein M3295_04335 [Chloroflexota bacterium]|nr:hypothetical protein [Chloroflexota bacterium]